MWVSLFSVLIHLLKFFQFRSWLDDRAFSCTFIGTGNL
jgi:hypothetical protein